MVSPLIIERREPDAERVGTRCVLLLTFDLAGYDHDGCSRWRRGCGRRQVDLASAAVLRLPLVRRGYSRPCAARVAAALLMRAAPVSEAWLLALMPGVIACGISVRRGRD